MDFPEVIGGLQREYFDAELTAASGIKNSIGPFHLIASWRSEAFDDVDGVFVFDAYDLLWVWSPHSLLWRIYCGRLEPKGTLDYRRGEILLERGGPLDSGAIRQLLLTHQARVRPERR